MLTVQLLQAKPSWMYRNSEKKRGSFFHKSRGLKQEAGDMKHM